MSDHLRIVGDIKRSKWFDRHNMEIGDHGRYKGNGRFGTRLGPEYSSSLFYHDLGHCIEWIWGGRPERIGQQGFGLGYTTVVRIGDEEYQEPVTAQGVWRECRVIAIELLLQLRDEPLLDVDYFLDTSASSLKYLGDYDNVPVVDTDDYSRKCELRYSEVRNRICRYLDKYTLHEIEYTWYSVRTLLKQYRSKEFAQT